MSGGPKRIFDPMKTRPRGWNRQLGRSQEVWKNGGSVQRVTVQNLSAFGQIDVKSARRSDMLHKSGSERLRYCFLTAYAAWS